MTRRAIPVVVAVLAGTTLSVSDPDPAVAVTVSNEAQLRAAYSDPNEAEITLASDITLTDCSGSGGALARNSATALTISGGGRTIRQTCTNEPVLTQDGVGALTLESVTITGGGGFNGGGIGTDGSVTVVGSTITGNTAENGAGINADMVVLRNSTVSGNTATDNGGGVLAGGAVNVVGSTITDNHATDGAGGGIAAEGATDIVNSTVTGNTGGTGGGIASGDTVKLVYATVVSNSAPTGANVDSNHLMSFASAIVLPAGGGANCELETSTASAGYNFSDDTSCNLVAGTDLQDGGNPDLGPLATNGGPTETRLPEPTSPLTDVIPTDSCQADGASGITTDQRGITRPQALFCDIGSVEVALPGSEPPAPPGPTPSPGLTPPPSVPPASRPSTAGPPVSAAPAAPIPSTAVRLTG